jgi:hypothetical protein
MDLQTTAELVIEQFKAAGGYSELDDDALYESIYGFLDDIYQKHLAIAQAKIKAEERRGIFPDTRRYDEAYQGVEDIVMHYANRLAATDRAEI